MTRPKLVKKQKITHTGVSTTAPVSRRDELQRTKGVSTAKTYAEMSLAELSDYFDNQEEDSFFKKLHETRNDPNRFKPGGSMNTITKVTPAEFRELKRRYGTGDAPPSWWPSRTTMGEIMDKNEELLKEDESMDLDKELRDFGLLDRAGKLTKKGKQKKS